MTNEIISSLSEYIDSLSELEKHVKSSKSKREIIEADCLFKGSQLLGSLTCSTAIDDVGLRMLLGASERTVGSIARYKQAIKIPTQVKAERIIITSEQQVESPQEQSSLICCSSLESLPAPLLDSSMWASTVLSSIYNKTTPITSSNLEVIRLRGFIAESVPVIVKYSLHNSDFFGSFFNSLSLETSYHLLRYIIKKYAAERNIDMSVLRIIHQAVIDYETSNSMKGNIVNSASRIVCDSHNVPKREIRLLVLSLYGPQYIKRGAVPEADINKTVKGVRFRVITKFGDNRNLQGKVVGEDHLCMSTIYFVERTPENIIQSHKEGLLSGVLNGIQARLGSPIPGYRKSACIAARCLSFVIDPDNPIEFEDYPEAYELWMDAEDGICSATTLNTNTEIASKKKSKNKQLVQEDPNECAFSDDTVSDQVSNGDDGDVNSFWSSDSESLEENKPADNPHDTTRLVNVMYLNDILKVFQGKREDVQELERSLSDLPTRLSSERLDEISSIGPQLFKAVLYLHNDFVSEIFDEKRHEALLILISTIPTTTLPQCIDLIWSQHMGTAQRLEVLKLLGLAAARMRLIPLKNSDKDDEDISNGGILKYGSRRKYPPTEYNESETYKNIVRERVDCKTRVIHKKRTQQAGHRNQFEEHSALFIYNLIGTWDSKHFNPFTAEDPMVLSELLRYLWGVSELLDNSGEEGQFVLLSMISFLWEMRKHELPYIISLVIAAATTAIISVRELPFQVADNWVQFAEDIVRGRVGKSDRACIALASNLLSAVQQQVDTLVGPISHQSSPKIEVL